MRKIVLGFLILLFFLPVGYGQKNEALNLPDYKVLAEDCNKVGSVGCCKASVRRMEKGKYLLDTGKSFKETTCPGGYEPDMMRCIDSYRWCVPVNALQQDKK